jgi:hypothetical protein
MRRNLLESRETDPENDAPASSPKAVACEESGIA